MLCPFEVRIFLFYWTSNCEISIILLKSGIQESMKLVVLICSALAAVGGIMHQFTPILFMDILYILIKFMMFNFSSSLLVLLLSWLLFGRILSQVIETHGDVPEICVTACK